MENCCKVVMLPTQKAITEDDIFIFAGKLINGCRLSIPEDKSIFASPFDNELVTIPGISRLEPKHLYILSDDKPIDDDRVIPNNLENPFNKAVYQFKKAHCPLPYWGAASTCKKIIATTDSSLTIDNAFIGSVGYLGIPYIPKPFIHYFISEYNKGNVITEVMVEYELYDNGNSMSDVSIISSQLKLNPDNTISIKPIQNMYSRDQVIALARDCFENSCKYASFKEWIKLNM